MSCASDFNAMNNNTPLTCVLDKVTKIIERRLTDTRTKADNLKAVYIAERSQKFCQDVIGLEKGGKEYLFNKVLESRQLALEMRNSDLERRLMVNETVNNYFEDVIREFETEVVNIIHDAKSAEMDRVTFCQRFKDENVELRKRLDEEEKHSLALLQDKEKLEIKLVEYQDKLDGVSGSLKKMEEGYLDLEKEHKKLSVDSAALLTRLKADGEDYKRLDDAYVKEQEENKELKQKIKALENQLGVEKRRVKAVCSDYEQRIETEKKVLKEELNLIHEAKLLEETNSNNLRATKMKEKFEKEMQRAADYVDECKNKLKKQQAELTYLKQNFHKKLMDETTKLRCELEKKYMKIASVPVTTKKASPDTSYEIDLENLPRRVLREWQQSDADSKSTSTVSARSASTARRTHR
ncbi:unnamed protein product [Bursaphelenchus okinawaensis]|uniref:Uncharacterized protein n=1 Tax=Bursaphelenchus okinawaensis TaxID=465554 RepID=A0A811LBL5_9BILA|nr:unnamed protein product [Bursaphelenchus okinawaensis]CAG9120327.1 unnamed protein product [Bursaphelenchus okinawaensis]